MLLELAILKSFNSGTYKAGVQLAGSLTTYFDDVPVSRAIPTSAMVVGNRVILAIPGDNPKDACVIATWPQGGGSFLDLTDTPASYSGQAGKYVKVNDAANALEFGYKAIAFVEGWTSNKILVGAGVGNNPTERYAADFINSLFNYAFFEQWKDLNGWTEAYTGSGGKTLNIMQLSLYTGTTSGSRSVINTGMGFFHPHHPNTNAIFMQIQSEVALTNSIIRIGLHKWANPSDTSGQGGFKIVNGQIYALTADGTDNTLTNTGVSIANAWAATSLRIVGTGSSVQYYVGNTLKAEHTTTLPPQWNYMLVLAISNDAAVNQQFRIRPIFCHG